jgi:gliding motility-associated-like protein
MPMTSLDLDVLMPAMFLFCLQILLVKCPVSILNCANATGTCSDSDAVVVNVACPVFVANVFSPVSDNEQNKTLGPSSPYLQEVYFVVYNRWGNKVFDSKTANTTRWNGKYKGVDADVDTYFYQIKYTCHTTKINYLLKGDVLLLR